VGRREKWRERWRERWRRFKLNNKERTGENSERIRRESGGGKRESQLLSCNSS
jgi:hypothetical protein